MTERVHYDSGDHVVVRDSSSNTRELVIIVNDNYLEFPIETASRVYEGLRLALLAHGKLSKPLTEKDP